jgi:phosphosulfolactate phosphohydrolase-like enzyme
VRKYLTKEELYVLLEEQHGAEVRVWDVDYSSGEFLGFYYDGDLIRIPTPDGACPACRAAARHAFSDATTPGFFYDKCERHRAIENPTR